MADFDLPMTGDELTPDEEPEAPTPEDLASELGLNLSDEERAEAEQMVAHLKEQFGLEQDQQPDEEEIEPEPEPDEEQQPEAEPEPPAPVAEQQPEWISIDGRAVPVAEARSMLELRNFLAQHPEKAEAVRAAIEGQPEAKKEPEPAAPPEWLDLDDPAQRFFWEQTQKQAQAIGALHANQVREAETRARADAVGQVNVAMDTFRRNHPELTEEEVQTVRTHAVALNIIPGLQQSRTGTEAVLKALDIAYMDHPDFRAKQLGQPSPKEKKQAESKDRKQKLAGVSGSSSTTTRQPEPPKKPESDREMKAQAAQWLSDQGIL